MAALPEAVLEHRVYGGVLLNRGLLVAAGEEFRRWLELVEPSGEPNLIVPPLNALCTVSVQRLDHEAALAWMDRALPYLDDPRLDPEHAARVRLNRLCCLLRLGRVDEAMAEALQAQEVVARVDSPGLAAVTYLNLSALYYLRREWVLMRRTARTAAEYFQRVGDAEGMAQALSNAGIAHMELGALKLARRDLQKALRLVPRHSVIAAYAYTELGRLAHLEGNLREAAEHATQALDNLLSGTATVDREEVAKVSELFGVLFAETGERNLALKYLNRSAAYMSQLGRLTDWERVTGRIAMVLTRTLQPGSFSLRDAVPRLDFLTAVLDLTDDIESVDPYLRGHSERVANLAAILGRAAGLSSRQIRLLKYAGRLHDVGKVTVEVEILRKPGDLTPAEWERIRIHPVIGEEMVRPYVRDPEALKAIRHHHEHWDGRGYPDGLRGKDIPLLARVIAVADVYDALTSDRAYRPAMTHGQAMRLIREMAGVQLDPDLAALFCHLHQV